MADAERAAFRSDLDIELAAVGGVRFAFDEAALFESGDRGAHRLRTHAFGAGEIGGGGGAVEVEAFEYGGFSEGKFVGSGSADATDEQADGLREFDGGGFESFARHKRSVAERQVNLQV